MGTFVKILLADGYGAILPRFDLLPLRSGKFSRPAGGSADTIESAEVVETLLTTLGVLVWCPERESNPHPRKRTGF